MASDAQVWWNMMGNYAPLKPYLEHLGIDASSIRQIHDSWRGLGEEAALGGNPNLLSQNAALAYFKSKYPTINQSMETITTTANPINSNFSNEEFNKLVSQFNLDIAQQMATVTTIGRHTYGYWRKYAPSFAVNMGDSVAELIANQRSIELPSITIPEAAAISEPEIQTITEPIITEEPEPDKTACYMVHGQKLELNEHAVNYYKNMGVSVTPCETQQEEKWSGWVTKPSGKIEYMTMTISTKQTLQGQGWIFTTEKPPAPQPENENISIIFYTGTGGDLKRHFNINSIIVTPEEKEELAGWLYQNYGTSIILAVNRLTNDIRTHTAQQVKAYVLQKIQDDTPEESLPPIPPTITGKTGIMGAGVAGAIGILILLGFIADSRRKK